MRKSHLIQEEIDQYNQEDEAMDRLYEKQLKDELKPCPFCGGAVSVNIRDAEGNLRDEEYERDPWSGLSYTIRHTHEENKGCPIAAYDGELLGVYLYESRKEATENWNKRV